jgi:hypothetical protein
MACRMPSPITIRLPMTLPVAVLPPVVAKPSNDSKGVVLKTVLGVTTFAIRKSAFA